MVKRRLFVACGLCAAMQLVAAPIEAQAQAAPGFARKVLGREDVPGGVLEVVQVLVTVEPNALIARHTHPGIESSAVLEGEGTLSVKGRENAVLRAGDGFLIPPELPHALQNSGRMMRVVATYTVEKGKPLASPAPE